MYYDYFWLLIPVILFTAWAQFNVSSTFNKYSKVLNISRMTGRDAALAVLRSAGVTDVRIERVSGKLTDHFDPRTNVIRLSDSVRGDVSVAAIGVAAHEAGHAVQYKTGYTPIKLRNAVLPAANLGSRLSIPLILLGFLLSAEFLVTFGILLFSLVLLFQVVTLPVEFNASRRAITTLDREGILSGEELIGVKKVLRAAALTYVAAALTTAMQLLRLILLSRRRD